MKIFIKERVMVFTLIQLVLISAMERLDAIQYIMIRQLINVIFTPIQIIQTHTPTCYHQHGLHHGQFNTLVNQDNDITAIDGGTEGGGTEGGTHGANAP
jgi:hypothetical protein